VIQPKQRFLRLKDADVLVVYAKTDPTAKKAQHGITAFIIEKVTEYAISYG
jgi:alkylation response protein AidB-like acyl-CoA dehydrogenase